MYTWNQFSTVLDWHIVTSFQTSCNSFLCVVYMSWKKVSSKCLKIYIYFDSDFWPSWQRIQQDAPPWFSWPPRPPAGPGRNKWNIQKPVRLIHTLSSTTILWYELPFVTPRLNRTGPGHHRHRHPWLPQGQGQQSCQSPQLVHIDLEAFSHLGDLTRKQAGLSPGKEKPGVGGWGSHLVFWSS